MSKNPSPTDDASHIQALRQAYLGRVAEEAGSLQLAGIDPKAASDPSGGKLQLSAVYTALMTQRPEDDEQQALLRGQRAERSEREVKRLSPLDVLNRERQLVLLGDPGSGKSTFVNFVAVCLAGEALNLPEANLAVLTAPLPSDERDRDQNQQPQPWRHGAILPVRIVLRDLAARGLPPIGQRANGDTLWRFIVAELGEALAEFAPYLKRELLNEGGLILLDGLDEVPDAQQRRVQVKQAVQDFAAIFKPCRFLVTSRTYAYQRQDWKLDGFTEAVLSPFTPAQIDRFVESWYVHIGTLRHLDRRDTQARAELLKRAIRGSTRLSELAERPLLLTLMASLHAWRGGSLPEKREELYADAVDLLLDQWESPKVVYDAQGQPVRQPSLAEWLKVDRAVVRTELNRLAYEAQRDQPQLVGTADINESKLVTALINVAATREANPLQLINYLRDRAGLLSARGEGVYTFPHRTFQEYLAACYLTDHGFPDDLADLARVDVNRWREVTLLAGAKAARGSTQTAWYLAEALVCCDVPAVGEMHDDADAWGALLAAQALIENDVEHLKQPTKRHAPKLERVRAWLRAIVERGWLPPTDRLLAGNALAVFGDDRDLDELIEIPAGSFLMGSGALTDDEKPQHEVTLRAYRIGKYPVTNAQYLRFVEAIDCDWQTAEGRKPEKANHPAVDLIWHDARAYCVWLTQQWHAEKRIADTEEVRLPTEAEWEKAARGMDGREWAWGNDWDETKCNSSELGLNDTSPVGMFPAGGSPYGCLDMSGNVWEWTVSLWGESFGSPEFKYPYHTDDGRENAGSGDEVLRVLRGGSFFSDQVSARCAYRGWYWPDYRRRFYGFRIVVALISQ
jgi:formylglycine-generating enzyme required for sulfatase activity